MASSTASSTSDVSRTTTVNAPTTISTHAEGRRSSAATTTGRSLVVDAFLRSSVRHQRSVLGFTPWRRATSAGFPPCSTSPTILVHSSRVRLFTRAIVAYPAPPRQPSIPRRLRSNHRSLLSGWALGTNRSPSNLYAMPRQAPQTAQVPIVARHHCTTAFRSPRWSGAESYSGQRIRESHQTDDVSTRLQVQTHHRRGM